MEYQEEEDDLVSDLIRGFLYAQLKREMCSQDFPKFCGGSGSTTLIKEAI